MKAFEIHTHRNGNWTMDSVFDDRNLAIHEARKADESSRYSGIRVIEETYDESTGLTTARVIFRGGLADKQKKVERAPVSNEPTQPKPRRGTGKEPVRKSKPPKEAKKKSVLVPVLLVFLVLVLGLGGLATLYQISHGG